MSDVRLTYVGVASIIVCLGGWSILWKDNPYYRFITHLLLGAGSAYGLIMQKDNLELLLWKPLIGGKYILIIPFIIGLLAFTRFSRKYFYLSRYPTGLLVGMATALMIRGWLDSMLVRQIATLATLFRAGMPTFDLLSNLLFLGVFIASIYVFIFSLPFTRSKPVGYIMKIGRYGLMLMLGLYFGATVMTRLEWALAPMLFLLLGIRG